MSAVPEAWHRRAPRLKTIAAWVNDHTTLTATVDRGYASTDRKLPGVRYRHAGKGRWGTRLQIYACAQDAARWRPALFYHNSAETYRRNSEVVEWLLLYLVAHPDVVRSEPRHD